MHKVTTVLEFSEARKMTNELRLDLGAQIAEDRQGYLFLPVKYEDGEPVDFVVLNCGNYCAGVNGDRSYLGLVLDRKEAMYHANQILAILDETHEDCLQVDGKVDNNGESGKHGGDDTGTHSTDGNSEPDTADDTV